ncbi:MAG: hypothetical protein KF712_16140 [Akkermansiaceae bacterium]|nr:hypothetical protein [Akkermansiaceae bacterium]
MTSRTVSLLVKYCLQLTGKSLASAFVLEMDPEVGWRMARRCAEARIEFPMPLTGRDHHVVSAYHEFLAPGRFANPVLHEAFRLYSGPESAVLKAMIIAGLSEDPDNHLQIVGEKMGLRKEVVEAFETLYFNVLDRCDETLYLANIVYPDGRLATLDEDYFARTSSGDLLLRAGYDYLDIELVQYLSGLRGNDFIRALMENGDAACQLEDAMHMNASLMLKVGGANVKSASLNQLVKLVSSGRKSRTRQPLTLSQEFDMAEELCDAISTPKSPESHPSESKRPAPVREDLVQLPAMEAKRMFADGSSIQNFQVPRKASWKNKDSDRPVVVIAIMHAPGKADHYLTEDKVGIPVEEVELLGSSEVQ